MKIFLLIILLFFTPIFKGIHATFSVLDMNLVLFNQNEQIDSIKIDSFNMMNMVKKEDIPYHEIDIDDTSDVIEVPQNMNDKKRIYIYSTHQNESYKDKGNVVEASIYLQKLLIDLGYEVIVENRDFTKELNNLGYDYSQSYLISKSAINDALDKYQGFDLIIDFHRDSLPRSSTFIKNGDKSYAKLMVVLGGLSSHFNKIYENATSLYTEVNKIEKGLMKNTLVREAYYNQDISEKMLLIEVGSDENYYQEVLNSIDILAEAINEIMRSQ